MKQSLAVSLALLLALFLLPLLVAGQTSVPQEPVPSETVLPAQQQSSAPPEPPSARQSPLAEETVSVLVDGNLEVIPLNDFLAGAVAAEMPALYPDEALKAQAVAIRTLVAYARDNPYHENALLCNQYEHCLAYAPLSANEAAWSGDYAAYAQKIRAAVEDTDGVIIEYDEKPIEAVYFAASGGRTLSAVEVWGGEVPYLQGVESPFDSEFPDGAKGHGVGMSQFGARQLALQGKTFEEILLWYYTGVEVTGQKSANISGGA